MITIIKPGYKLGTFYEFRCKSCGCEAEVTENELLSYSKQFICPYCKTAGDVERVVKKIPLNIPGVEPDEFPFVLLDERKKDEK